VNSINRKGLAGEEGLGRRGPIFKKAFRIKSSGDTFGAWKERLK